MKCPVCGKEVLSVCAHIDHPADILGCYYCLPPELDSEDIIDLFEEDLKEMDVWLDGMEEDDVNEEAEPPVSIPCNYPLTYSLGPLFNIKGRI